MDLFAYLQISDIEQIAKANNIVCPRLRGYRLMKNEERETLLDIYDASVLEDLCRSLPRWNIKAYCYCYSSKVNTLIKNLIKINSDGSRSIRWDKIHGRKRKILKFALKQKRNRCQAQIDTWNKYVGREDILYIHARIGGGNWASYKDEVEHQPWFIEKVDDAFDSTYCDIYAKISV